MKHNEELTYTWAQQILRRTIEAEKRRENDNTTRT